MKGLLITSKWLKQPALMLENIMIIDLFNPGFHCRKGLDLQKKKKKGKKRKKKKKTLWTKNHASFLLSFYKDIFLFKKKKKTVFIDRTIEDEKFDFYSIIYIYNYISKME